MAKVKRVEAKIILQKNDEGYWLLVDSPSGKHAMVNIENLSKGTVRETFLEWADRELDPLEPRLFNSSMATKRKKTKSTECPCYGGWVCEVHPDVQS